MTCIMFGEFMFKVGVRNYLEPWWNPCFRVGLYLWPKYFQCANSNRKAIH